MIAKIKTGAFFKGAFKYNLDKVKEGDATFFYHSMFSQENPSFDDMQHEFLEISKMCPNVSKPVFHASLNFSPDDFLDDETLQSVVDEYMERLGYGNTPYVVFKHNDTNHQHVHIISSNIELIDGKYKKINDSYLHRRSEAISRRIEKEYNLVVATDVNRKKNELDQLVPELKGYGEVATYEQLKDVSEYIVSTFNFTNLVQLNSLLNRYNIACFKSKTKKGEEYYKFTFQNPATRKNVGVGGTPSQLGLSFSSEKLKQIMEENKEGRGVDVEKLQQWKQELLSQYLFITNADLDKFLVKKGMVKIDEGHYFDKESRSIVSRYQLKLPPSFIDEVTLKKEYFQNMTKSATEYRKQASVFHESTMFSKTEYINGFRNFFFNQEDTHLTSKQKNLLFDTFISYKSKNITKTYEKEREKDIKQVNKMFDYVSNLNISDKTARCFLEHFNISLEGNKVMLGNSVDRVVHELDLKGLNYFFLNGPDKINESNSLNPEELDLIRAAMNNKPCSVSRDEINWDNVSPFIPESYATAYHLEERLSSNEIIIDEFVPEEYQQTFSPQFFSSKNEFEYLPRKKKKKKGDDDEKGKRKGRRRV